MRKLPMPKSIGLTKTTCQNIYRQGGRYWFTCKLEDGSVWYTNGHVAMSKIPPYKGCEKFISSECKDLKEGWVSDTEGDYRLVFLGCECASIEGLTALRLDRPMSDNDPSPAGFIDTRYAELMRGTYPRCTFRIAEPPRAVKVYDSEDNLVAYIYRRAYALLGEHYVSRNARKP